MELRLHLLGPPQVLVGDRPLEVDTRKATALLIYLTVTGEISRRESLAAMLWPESDGPHAKAALRRTLSALRKALKDGDWLQADREVVSAAPDWLDCEAFTQLIEKTRDHGHASDQACDRCIEPLTQAAELYRGDFLEGFTLPDSPDFDDWQYFHMLGFQRQLAEALQRLAIAHQQRQEYEIAAEHASRLLSLDPLNEAAHRMLMTIYARSGLRQMAQRQYQDCVRVLQEELGTPPLDQTVALNERIAAGELELPSRLAPAAAAGRAGVAGATQMAGAATGTELAELPMVERQPQLAEIRAWYQGIDHDPRLLVIEGELGIGKSRLASEFARQISSQGARLLRARCYPDEATFAYRPWTDALRAGLGQAEAKHRLESVPSMWLAETARLLPELRQLFPELERVEPTSRSGGQDRFLESIVQLSAALLAGPIPGVLLLDDLHWADESSLELLTYLLRHGSQVPVLVLAAWRTEGLVGEHELRAAMQRFPRERSRLIRLERLSEARVQELASYAGLDGVPIGESLYRETEGLPFFVSEYIRAVGSAERGGDQDIPPSVRQAIEGRLDRLSGTGKQLLSTAAIIGRSFEFETLRMVSGRSPEETVTGLEELVGVGSIREFPSSSPRLGPAYDFVHDKLREVVLEGTTQARQRLLHARTATALVRLQGRREGELLAARIAHHLLRAGDEQAAAEMYLQAAEHARSVYANEEALAHYRSAQALGHPEQAALHEAIADLLTLTGRYQEAVQNYETAEALQPESGIARIEHKLGGVYERRGDWERAANHFAAATQAAASGAEQARTFADWSLTAHRQGASEQAARLIGQALAQAESAGDLGAQAQCHNIQGILARAAGDAQSARQHLRRSLELADQLSDRGARAAALNNLALVLAEDGELESALEAEQEALDICQSIGDRHRAAALHSNLADLLHQAGQREASQQHLTQSAELFAAVGVDSGEYEPEIWKLVEW